jgi:hypothetical protein
MRNGTPRRGRNGRRSRGAAARRPTHRFPGPDHRLVGGRPSADDRRASPSFRPSQSSRRDGGPSAEPHGKVG